MLTSLSGSNWSTLRRALAVGTVLAGTAAWAMPASATAFATFSDQTTTGSVKFTNLPTTTTTTTTTVNGKNVTVTVPAYTGSTTATVANDPVNFDFVGFPGMDRALLGPQSALLNYTMTTTNGANSAILGASTFDAQNINQSVTISFTRTTPYIPKGHPTEKLTNLLTVTLSGLQPGGTTAEMTGIGGSQSVSVNSDATYANVTFTSDFLNFANTSQHSVAIAYTLQTSQFLGIGAKFLTAYDLAMGGNAGGPTCTTALVKASKSCNYRGFTAAESGNFGATPPPLALFTVAEPASIGIFGLGVIGAFVASRRRRAA